jgi:hypothetical protein
MADVLGDPSIDIYWSMVALENFHANLWAALNQGLKESAIYVAARYADFLHSKKAAKDIGFSVSPPRAYVGIKRMGKGHKGYVATFEEMGAKPHAIVALGRIPRLVGRGKNRRQAAAPYAWQGHAKALPLWIGGTTIFRTKVRHPGMAASRPLERAAEVSEPVIEELIMRALANSL